MVRSRQWILAIASVALLGFGLSNGCSGDTPPFQGGPDPVVTDPGAPCTNPLECCTEQELVCTGNPDKGVVCTCKKLWDCSYDESKCERAVTPPDGSGGWECKNWDEFSGVTCEKTGTTADVPSGGGQWICNYDQEHGKVVCKENPPSSPPNTPEGAAHWACTIQAGDNGPMLVCERKTPPPTQPSGGGNWTCDNPEHPTTCTNPDTLPSGGGSWSCHEETIGGKKYVVCTGESATNPGGSGNWTCEKMPNQDDKWICKRPKTGSDLPSGGGYWSCVTGSEFNGTKCTKSEVPVTPPPQFPQPGDICVPGTERWCDGLQFCGWGTVTCLPDGTWPTKTLSNGKKVLDCNERADGRRPDTDCACYHFYFNPKCCETPDCKVTINPVDGKPGRECAQSPGQLCDYCNPQKSECKVGICAVSNSMETFCTKHCGAGGQCPTNTVCMPVNTEGGSSNECIPSDLSCYNGL